MLVRANGIDTFNAQTRVWTCACAVWIKISHKPPYHWSLWAPLTPRPTKVSLPRSLVWFGLVWEGVFSQLKLYCFYDSAIVPRHSHQRSFVIWNRSGRGGIIGTTPLPEVFHGGWNYDTVRILLGVGQGVRRCPSTAREYVALSKFGLVESQF